MTIYSSFKPTYLYIKRHSITGKLYFGKTVGNPETYKGSGLLWTRHINKHGRKNVETLWYCLFLDQESITEFALNFSRQNNIVESDDWLNMKPENGLDGATYTVEIYQKVSNSLKGRIHSAEAKHNMSKSQKGKIHSPEARQKMSEAHLGKTFTEESKKRMSDAGKGVKKEIVSCPHCEKLGGIGVMKRWHFDNCSSIKSK